MTSRAEQAARGHAPRVTLSGAGAVGIVTFDNPPANHLSVNVLERIADMYDAVERDADLRVIVLRSEGKNFCAGADLVSDADAGGLGDIGSFYRQAARLFDIGKPVVAAVQGSAIGAGLGLALSADFRIASGDARFSANFVKLAFHPGFATTWTLPRLIGSAHADLMFLTGRRIRAVEALGWGLVNDVVPGEGLVAAALALAQEIAANGPLGVFATRATLRRGVRDAVRAQMQLELAEQTALRPTMDHAEGIQAVQERRPGRFQGK